jgi:hypothetical protein
VTPRGSRGQSHLLQELINLVPFFTRVKKQHCTRNKIMPPLNIVHRFGCRNILIQRLCSTVVHFSCISLEPIIFYY